MLSATLPTAQADRYGEFEAFVSEHVTPAAAAWDQEQRIPPAAIVRVAKAGYLGSTVPSSFGGMGWDTVTYGLLHEAFGRGSSALTDLLTVQAMVSMTLVKWGSAQQKSEWLPRLARGEVIAAYALTEPAGGSDLNSLATELIAKTSDRFVLRGVKTWISFGQTAAVFLVFGQLNGHSVACLVPGDAPGLRKEPIADLLGFRAAGLARVTFEDVELTATNLVGKPGVALSHIVPIGLQYGRISTACSAVGLIRACFEASASYAAERRIGQGRAGDFGMIRSILARLGTDYQAARLLCWQACASTDARLPEAFTQAVMAKYFSSQAAVRAASDAVQIHGAAGCHPSWPVSRYYRDAKVMEIIEGTTQIHEEILGRTFLEGTARTPS